MRHIIILRRRIERAVAVGANPWRQARAASRVSAWNRASEAYEANLDEYGQLPLHMQDDSGQPLYPWMRSDD